MSALTERVAREHQSYSGIECACGHYPDHDEPLNAARTRHLIAVTEAATRAAVADDIRARLNVADLIKLADTYSGYYQGVRAGYQDAIEIVGGKP